MLSDYSALFTYPHASKLILKKRLGLLDLFVGPVLKIQYDQYSLSVCRDETHVG